MSYHLTTIKKGVLGELSKIQEELDEIKDSEAQNNKIMIGCELSDLYGAIEAYANKFGLTMNDLSIMSEATKRAFKSGRRISQQEESNVNTDSKLKSFVSDICRLITHVDYDFYIVCTKQSKNNSLHIYTKSIRNLNTFDISIMVNGKVYKLKPNDSLKIVGDIVKKVTIMGTEYHSMMFICDGTLNYIEKQKLNNYETEKYEKVFIDNVDFK